MKLKTNKRMLNPNTTFSELQANIKRSLQGAAYLFMAVCCPALAGAVDASVASDVSHVPDAFVVHGTSAAFAGQQETGCEEGTVNIRSYDVVGDGRADDTVQFRQAIDDMDGAGCDLVLPHGDYKVGDLMIPGNVSLVFRGGVLQPGEGRALEINGTIVAAGRQIFAGEGIVSGRLNNRQVYPQWFGARGDGDHNDAPALQKAADLAAGSAGNTLFIPDGEYRFDEDLHFRSNIESHGLLIKEIEIDEEQTDFDYFTFVPTHHPKNNPHIRFVPDHEEMELEAELFYGMKEGETVLPAYRDVPLADGSGTIDLADGGTVRFHSTDFFTSRGNKKGDELYDKNDISQVVSGRGDIFPELAFSYAAPPEAGPWSEEEIYRKGDFAELDGEIYKSTWPSGEGTVFEDRFLGTVDIGPVQPEAPSGGAEDRSFYVQAVFELLPHLGEATTWHRFEFNDGSSDSISVWRNTDTNVWYRPKDKPLTVDGLRVEVRLSGNEGESKRISSGALKVSRSHMTFNNLEVTVRDPEATMLQLFSARNAVNVEVNNGYFSGATFQGLGYNILMMNVADFRFNDCTSVNSRKGMDAGHAKNVAIRGGHYNVIDSHYGRNYLIRDVVMSGRSIYLPGYVTPDADLQGWGFRTTRPFGFAGANLHIENATVTGGNNSILRIRGDTPDFYGTVVLRDITVRDNEGDVLLFTHGKNPEFDYIYDVLSPTNMIIEDIVLENPGRLNLNIGSGFNPESYGPVRIRNSGPFGNITTSSSSLTFSGCSFENAEFTNQSGAEVNFRNCIFSGNNTGLGEESIGSASGNSRARGAQVSFPIEFLNRESYEQ